MKSDELLKLAREVEDMENKIIICDDFLKSLKAGNMVASIKVSTCKNEESGYNFSGTLPINGRALYVIQKMLEIEVKDTMEELNKKLDDIKI